MAIGETYSVVLELAVPKENQNDIGRATIQWVDTFARENRRSEVDFSLGGDLSSGLIVQHALGLWTSEVVFYAFDDLFQQDFETARRRIETHVSLLESANPALSSDQLRNDIVALQKFLALAGNLGEIWAPREGSVPSAQTILVHSLNEFGRVRSGFNRVSHGTTGP